MRIFGDNLILLRRRRGISQAHLADLVGVTRATIGSYEGSKNDPGLSTALAIAREMGQNLDDMSRISLHTLTRPAGGGG